MKPTLHSAPKAFLLYVRLGLLALILFSAVVTDRMMYESRLNESREDTLRDAKSIAAQFDGFIVQNTQALWGLRAMILTDPDLDQSRFSLLARDLYRGAPHLKHVAAAPGLRIGMVYPLEENRAALGLDYRAQPEQWPDVSRAIESNVMVVSDPVAFVQGGYGVIGRLPVTLENGELWGLVSVTMSLDDLSQALAKSATGYRLEIINRENGATVLNVGDNPLVNPVMMPLQLPGRAWSLAVMPEGGWPNYWQLNPLKRLLLTALVVFMAAAVWGLTRMLLLQYATQRQLQGLYAASPSGLVLRCRNSGNILDVNPAICRWTGLSRSEILASRSILTLYGDEPYCLISDAEHVSHEGQLRCKNGKSLDIKLHVIPQHDLIDDSLEWLIVQNVTTQRAIERMKDEFISTISHELRTPITSANGAVKMLQSVDISALPDNGAKLLAVAASGLGRLQTLVEDMLSAKALLEDSIAFQVAPMPLATALDQVVQHFAADLQQKKIELHSSPFDEKTLVFADQPLLIKALDHLLRNACKFTPVEGRIRIDVAVRDTEVVISVNDSGDGLDEHLQQNIFKPFVQKDGSNTRQQGGVGIGLLIVKRIVDRMGGSVGYQHSYLGGACFWITLPRHQSA